MKITPDIWGKHGWKFMHFIALAYPNTPTLDDKNNYKTFFYLIGDVLPCKLCGSHYKENLLKHPLTDSILSSKEKLLDWTIDMHNEVNVKTNKKVYDYATAKALIIQDDEPEPMPVEEEFTSIDIDDAEEPKNQSNLKYTIIFIVVILAILIYYLYTNKYKKNYLKLFRYEN